MLTGGKANVSNHLSFYFRTCRQSSQFSVDKQQFREQRFLLFSQIPPSYSSSPQYSITPHSQLTFHGGGGIGDSATQGPVSQIIRWKGEEEGGAWYVHETRVAWSPLLYATRELAETLMKNGKDVMHCIGCLANAAMLLAFLIDAWMWGFSGWANGIYTYRLCLLHLCKALFLSAIESHVSWKGGSSLHRKCSHLATLVNPLRSQRKQFLPISDVLQHQILIWHWSHVLQ